MSQEENSSVDDGIDESMQIKNDGSWICPGCGISNYKSDPKCWKCNTDRPIQKIHVNLEIKKDTEKKTVTCPFCGETILAIAVKCKHCQSNLGDVNMEGTSFVKINDTFVWLIAWMPLLIALFEAFVFNLYNYNSLVYYITIVIIYSSLVSIDTKNIKDSGRTAPSLGWIFFLPVYLYQRSKFLGKTQAPLITMLIAVFFSLFIPFLA